MICIKQSGQFLRPDSNNTIRIAVRAGIERFRVLGAQIHPPVSIRLETQVQFGQPYVAAQLLRT